MQWNFHSNVSDVLDLGPRTAGRLATVGIRTVGQLCSAQAAEIARRLLEPTMTTDVLSTWQAEANLIMSIPQLPATAARLLAIVGFNDPSSIARCTPTELLAKLDSAQRECVAGWLTQIDLPAIEEVGNWIHCASDVEKTRAA